MLSDIGSVLAGLLALATILMGARYLLDPSPAAAGFVFPEPRAPPCLVARGSPSRARAISPSASLSPRC
jgi:hypothetical protein